MPDETDQRSQQKACERPLLEASKALMRVEYIADFLLCLIQAEQGAASWVLHWLTRPRQH